MTVTWAVTGLPRRVAGSYRYCFRASMAASRKEAGPARNFIAFTRPNESTTASSVTVAVLLVSKYCNAFGEAIARTDLISFGGTSSASFEDGAAQSAAALLDGRSTERFPAEAATTDFSCTATASTAASPGAGGSGAASVDGLGALC